MTLSTLWSIEASAETKLDVGNLRLQFPIVVGQAPQLLHWPDGLPKAMSIEAGRVWVNGKEYPVDRGLYMPQELALEFYARMQTLEAYQDICQAVIDASTKMVYDNLKLHIDQQDAWIKEHKDLKFSVWDAIAGGILFAAGGLLAGLIVGGVAF